MLYADIQNYLLLASESQLHRFSLDANFSTHVTFSRNVSSMNVDILSNQVYWTELSEPKIFTAPLSFFFVGMEGGGASLGGVQSFQAVVFDDLISPMAVIVDWIGRTLYWADSGTGSIEVLDLEGGSRRVLVEEDLVHVTSLALDLVSRYNYEW